MYNTRICFHYEHLTRILTTRSVFVAALCLLMVCGGFCEAAQRTQPIFMNEFAVRLSSGDAADADRIAAKHGFVNVGQKKKEEEEEEKEETKEKKEEEEEEKEETKEKKMKNRKKEEEEEEGEGPLIM
ncbi:hypothetical protein M8J76_017103 [Diaphorina citri]|nr:hypothetical protein M8J76_017103 [Diaphorina citri]